MAFQAANFGQHDFSLFAGTYVVCMQSSTAVVLEGVEYFIVPARSALYSLNEKKRAVDLAEFCSGGSI